MEIPHDLIDAVYGSNVQNHVFNPNDNELTPKSRTRERRGGTKANKLTVNINKQ